MVGRGGLEPPTLRLSGVRSNHLSYRPMIPGGNPLLFDEGIGGRSRAGPRCACRQAGCQVTSRSLRTGLPEASLERR